MNMLMILLGKENLTMITSSMLPEIILGFTLSCAPISTFAASITPGNLMGDEEMIKEMSLTSSVNDIVAKYNDKSPSASCREEAMSIFGNQSDFTEEEMVTYRNVLRRKSKKTGISV